MYFLVVKNSTILEHNSFLFITDTVDRLVYTETIKPSDKIEIWDENKLICRYAYDHEKCDEWKWKEPLHLVK